MPTPGRGFKAWYWDRESCSAARESGSKTNGIMSVSVDLLRTQSEDGCS